MNLFEIDRAIQECKKPVVDANTGEITSWEIDMEALEALEMERDTKIRNIACYIKNLAADELALAGQEKAFAERKRAARNMRESLKSYLTAYLDGKGVKGLEFAISFRTTTGTEVLNEKAIPDEYLIPQEPKVDRAGALRDLKAGKEIPGITLKQNLSITVK